MASGANGLGVIRSLYLKELKATSVTLSDKDIVNYSRLPRKKIVIKGETTSSRHQWLLDFLSQQPNNTVVLPTSDWFVAFLTMYSDRLKDNCCFVLPPAHIADLLIDKALETETVSKIVPLPKTVTNLSSPASLLEELELPVIIKPRSHLHMVLGQKNIILSNQKDVDSFFEKFGDKLDNLIAQEVIIGDDDQQRVCNCVFDTDSKLIQAFTFIRLSLSPSHYGVTSYALSEHNEKIIGLSKTLGKELGYIGPAMIEFKKDARDGIYKYIEINPRFGLCNFFDTSCGINNPYAVYLLAQGKASTDQPKMKSNVIFLSAYEDFYSRIRNGESIFSILKTYLLNIGKPHYFIYFVWWDPWPAVSLGGHQLTAVFRSLIKKVFFR